MRWVQIEYIYESQLSDTAQICHFSSCTLYEKIVAEIRDKIPIFILRFLCYNCDA